MLFVFQEECVFVRAEEAKIEEVQNERPAEGAVALAGEVGGGGYCNMLQNKGHKTGLINSRGGGTFAHISSQMIWDQGIRLIPMTLGISVPIVQVRQAESGVLPPRSHPVGYYDLSDLLSSTNEVNLL